MCNLCTVLRHCVFYTQRCRLFRRVLFCTIGSYISSSLRGLLNVFRTSATCYVERGDSSEKGETRLTDLCIVFNSHRKKRWNICKHFVRKFKCWIQVFPLQTLYRRKKILYCINISIKFDWLLNKRCICSNIKRKCIYIAKGIFLCVLWLNTGMWRDRYNVTLLFWLETSWQTHTMFWDFNFLGH